VVIVLVTGLLLATSYLESADAGVVCTACLINIPCVDWLAETFPAQVEQMSIVVWETAARE
jgi:hypothetical protein